MQYSPVQLYSAPQAYSPYNSPYSRRYVNPYAYPPRNYYPYYDYDQYYVPPSNYSTGYEGYNSRNSKPGFGSTGTDIKY